MSSSQTYFVYRTPMGRMSLAACAGALTHCVFGPARLEGDYRATEITNQAANQLLEYFAGRRREFDVPLNPAGTPFQRSVWEELQHIPYGETRSYSQVAAALNNPRALRAVGAANNKNPLMIFIPCHRVIGANGNLVGYAAGLSIKKFLLDLEANTLAGDNTTELSDRHDANNATASSDHHDTDNVTTSNNRYDIDAASTSSEG